MKEPKRPEDNNGIYKVLDHFTWHGRVIKPFDFPEKMSAAPHSSVTVRRNKMFSVKYLGKVGGQHWFHVADLTSGDYVVGNTMGIHEFFGRVNSKYIEKVSNDESEEEIL